MKVKCSTSDAKIPRVIDTRSFNFSSLAAHLHFTGMLLLSADITCLLVCVTSILVTAFVGTAIAFGCFSCAAIIAKRREYLYLGGLLSSGLSILIWLQFAASIFGHPTRSFMFEVRYIPATVVLAIQTNISGIFFAER